LAFAEESNHRRRFHDAGEPAWFGRNKYDESFFRARSSCNRIKRRPPPSPGRTELESLIMSPVTIYIDVDYGTTNFGQAWPTGVLGSTSAPGSSYPYHPCART